MKCLLPPTQIEKVKLLLEPAWATISRSIRSIYAAKRGAHDVNDSADHTDYMCNDTYIGHAGRQGQMKGGDIDDRHIPARFIPGAAI